MLKILSRCHEPEVEGDNSRVVCAVGKRETPIYLFYLYIILLKYAQVEFFGETCKETTGPEQFAATVPCARVYSGCI